MPQGYDLGCKLGMPAGYDLSWKLEVPEGYDLYLKNEMPPGCQLADKMRTNMQPSAFSPQLQLKGTSFVPLNSSIQV